MMLDLVNAGSASKVRAAGYWENTGETQDPRKSPSNVAAAARDDHTYGDWVLFDFVFGLPLFDQLLNAQVMQCIQNAHLFDPSR
jgi:hypothetical protein